MFVCMCLFVRLSHSGIPSLKVLFNNICIHVLPNFPESHQYRRGTDGLVGTGLMPYKAQYPKISTFDAVSDSSVLEI